MHLAWAKRLSDDEFVLQMDDRFTKHGFLTCYNGPAVQYVQTGLRRNTAYRFRLQAHNEEGKSNWSEDICFMTLPDVPGAPLRPASKGRIHPHSFKIRWDAPSDDGGVPISAYSVEISEDDSSENWRTVYNGHATECHCDGLRPGTVYKIRVRCYSDGGVSPFSEICHVTTEPVCPGQCAPPRVHGKPRASSLHLKWGWPDHDGGAPVSEFEIDMTSPDNQTRGVYKGRETECVVASLLPGRPYLFQVRAHNRAGVGPWSDSLEVVSGAGCPDQPKEPKVMCKISSSDLLPVAHVTWEEPINNGAIIAEYVVQMALVRRKRVIYTQKQIEEVEEEEELVESLNSEDEDEESQDEEEEAEDLEEETQSVEPEEVEQIVDEDVASPEFVKIYGGPNLNFDAKSLEPAALYYFRICAVNAAGQSEWSNSTETRTPPCAPAQVTQLLLRRATSDALTVSWQRPEANGDPVCGYRVRCGREDEDGVAVQTKDTQCTVQGLRPDTVYNVRVQVSLEKGYLNIYRL